MKKIFLVVLTAVSSYGFAQVAIGKKVVSNSGVSLEFGDGNKGIILPWVNSAAEVAGTVAPGTIIYDVADRKVKVKNLDGWRDLSREAGVAGAPGVPAAVDTSLQDSFTESSNAKVIIGSDKSDPTPGILVLSDTDKAMVLPKMVSPHLNIKNPEAGTMAYDTEKHQLVIYNGTVWTFWKA